MKRFSIGVDVGNCDTKTSFTVLPSGLVSSSNLTYGVDEYILFNGMYYIPSEERFFYKRDKMNDDNMFILTLCAIAKELVFTISKKTEDKAQIQEAINQHGILDLGVGLPPAHISSLGKKMEDYYTEHFSNGVSFEYNGFHFRFRLGIVKAFPQDFAAIMTYKPKDEKAILNVFDSYYGIDIGGYTVDLIPIVKGKPDVMKCITLELGVLRLYDDIISKVDMQYNLHLTHEIIEGVLRKSPTILDEDVVAFILSCAEKWVNNIMDALRQSGVQFDLYPVIFLGGGSELFKPYIKKCSILKKYDFIPGANANAKGYKKLIAAIVKSAA